MSLEGVVRKERNHVESHLRVLLAHQHQLALHRLVTVLFDAFLVGRVERQGVALPAVASHLHLPFRHHKTLLTHQSHRQRLTSAIRQPRIERAIILRTTVEDAVPALVVQRVGSDDHIVRIVGTERLVCGDGKRHTTLPSRCSTPSAVVSRRVFKITVLHQFRIQSAIGCIADVFKENTDEFVRDGLTLRGIYAERSPYDGRQCLEAFCIVAHRLLALLRIVGQPLEVRLQLVEIRLRDLKPIALHAFPVYGSRVRLPCPVGVSSGSLLEMSEISRCFNAQHPLFGLQEEVKRAVCPLADERLCHTFHREFRIVLWSPRHQVVAVGCRKAWCIVVDGPYRPPGAVLGTQDEGIVHPLLRAPARIVRRTQLSEVLPTIFLVEESHMKAVPFSW